MKKLVAILAMLSTACGNYSFEQGWDGVPCIRIPDGTDPQLAVALLRAIDDWQPLPTAIEITPEAWCNNEIRWGDPFLTTGSTTAVATTPTCIALNGHIHERDIVVSPDVPDCRIRAVVRHEFGHFLGLETHSPEGGGVMVEKILGCDDPQVSDAERARVKRLYT